MTPEEFLMKNPNQYLGMTPVEFAEAYHKHRVNAISDEEIDNQFKYGFAHYYKEGIKWFKNKLLKP